MMITLTGFMGSGKTTVGKVLADFLGCPFMDLDDLVVKKAGKSIPDIFAQDGEPAFRELEAQVLRKTVAKYAESTAVLALKTVAKYAESTAVLALGGGAVLAPASAALLHEKTVCIYLRATLDTLLARLEGETAGRPLADASLADRLASREPTRLSFRLCRIFGFLASFLLFSPNSRTLVPIVRATTMVTGRGPR